MSSFLPPSFISLFSSFAPVFTAPTFMNFIHLITGWILCSGRHTVSKALQAIGPVHAQKHYSVFYRLFSRARWNPDRIGEVLFQLVLPFIPGVNIYLLKGRIEDRAYFYTDLDATPEHLLAGFARGWTLEVTFFNIKQFLGLEDPQNGWGLGPAGPRREKPKPGPQPRGQRGAKAVQRTVPFVFVTYALIHLWYLQHGNVAADVQAVKARSPWYRHKTEPSFYDMLRAVRKAICIPLFLQDPTAERVQQKIESVLEFLCEMPSAA